MGKYEYRVKAWFSLGAAIAGLASFNNNHSLSMALVHSLCSWVYVGYSLIGGHIHLLYGC